MTSGFEITCANKNPRGTIVRVGGQGWSMGIHEAILGIMTNELRLRILVSNEYFDIGVRGEGFDSYLALEPDGKPLHELEHLPSC